MKWIRCNQRKCFCLLCVPVIFLLTVFVLNSHITGSENLNSSQLRGKLIAARKIKELSAVNDHQGDRVKVWRVWDHKGDRRDSEGLDKEYNASQLNMLGLITSPEDQMVRDEGDRNHAFNELVSERLSFHRHLPDTRHELCKSQGYRADLPPTSVIICFHNEAWSTILRTVHSVLDRTPADLLYEIVLVDDDSDLPYLKEELAEYVWNVLPHKVKIVRTARRLGLIRARMYGAVVATGKALVFLDSHCEVNIRWLEPLLARITNDVRTVAVPVIDIINPDSFEYKGSPLVKGGFNWGLHFTWDQLPEDYFNEKTAFVNPIESPTMAGGLFAVDRKYFNDMGGYDTGMDIWGGENLEMSFRIWQCHGKIEIVPCSRVGHIFRRRRPYGSPNGEDTMMKNSLRVAHVWMDDYIKYYFQIRPEAEDFNYGNVTDRLELRKRLKCNTFEWFLKFIYPERSLPDGQPNKNQMKFIQKYQPKFIGHGLIQHSKSGLCIGSEKDIYSKKSLLILSKCKQGKKELEWYETDEKELRLSQILCLDVEGTSKPGDKSFARLMKCHGGKGSQAWIWSTKGSVSNLYNPGSGKCLLPVVSHEKTYLTVGICAEEEIQSFTLLGVT